MPHRLRTLIADLPVPAPLRSDRIVDLLRKAIAEPRAIAPGEVKEIAVSAAFHIVATNEGSR